VSGNATRAQGAHQSPIKRGRRLPYFLLAIAITVGIATVTKDATTALPVAPGHSNDRWAQLYAALPMSFEANRGQSNPSVDFLSRGKGYTLFLTGREAVLTLKAPAGASRPSADGKPPANTATHAASVVQMQLLGSNPSPRSSGSNQLPGIANYFIGKDPSKWRTNVPTYAKVRYEDVYPGVNLIYYGTQGGQLEYDFAVAPGADPNTIALAINAGSHAPAHLDADGNLVLPLKSGNLEFHKPVAYQAGSEGAASASRRKPVEARYTLDAQNHVHFECGPYDHRRELIIDPVLLYATYIGGTGGDVGYSIAVDSTTYDAYITGQTNSTNFPLTTTPGLTAYQTNYGGAGDAFVSQINSAGTAIAYSTYVGGSGSDIGTGIALLNSDAYVTGYTTSADFPVTAPAGSGPAVPFQQTYGGSTDAFVLELNNRGNTLIYSTYLGGNGADFGQAIAVDSTGTAYITGTTQSPNFPIVTPYQSVNNGGQDAFVAKLDFAGENLLYSTFLGGSKAESAQGIALDSSNDMFITGYTNSSDFPLASPYQAAIGGANDAFVTELNAAGSALVFSTYLGGSADDRAYGIALDGSKNVYITGATSSTNFPTATGAFQPSLRGSSNAFVTEFNPGGNSLLYSTYLGGSGTDQASSIAVTPAGIAFVTGSTNSSDFPTGDAIQGILGLANNGQCSGNSPCPDAFVTQIDTVHKSVVYSTFLGGNNSDIGLGIAVDNTGLPYITGTTSSTNFPAIANGSFSSALTGNVSNAFIAKIGSQSIPNVAILPSKVNFGNVTNTTTSPVQQILIVNPSDSPLTITDISVALVGLSSTVFQETDNCIGTIPGGGAYCTMNVTFTPNTVGNITDTITLTDNAGALTGTEQTINLSGTGVTAATAVTVNPTNLTFATQAVGTISAAQTVTVTNTGSEPLNLTKISTGSTDFAETDNCLSAPNNGVLAPQAPPCTISVTFTPTASGTRSSALTISDNATGSPQSVILSGTGAAAFNLTEDLSTNKTTNPTIIGSTQTQFTIDANVAPGAPQGFNNAITLTCSAGMTCAFSPNPIFPGQASTLIVSNLNPNPTSNPLPFSVTGTSGSQSFTLPLSLEFSDFTLTAAPSSTLVESGSVANYTVNINPLFPTSNENQQVSLIISKTSPALADYTYTFNPATVTINPSGPTQSQLQIQTTKFLNPTIPGGHAFPRIPRGPISPWLVGIASILALGSIAIGHRRRRLTGRLGRGWLVLRLGALSSILALNLAMAACRPNILAIDGTATGSYVITIQGTLVSNTSVIRTVTVDLSVTQGQVSQ
jgi:hypothetical protein